MLVRSMVLARLGRGEEAKSWFDKAQGEIESSTARALTSNQPWSNPWERRVTLAALQREAERVLSKPPTSDSVP
jgi:hypothetical protein